MPSVAQLARYMSATNKVSGGANTQTERPQFTAAMPLHALKPLNAQEVPLRFADQLRIVRETGFGVPVDQDQASIGQELDDMLESDFDEAAVPSYQLI